MHSPYLDQLLVPLAVALPRMLAKIEAKIPKSAPPEKSRLQNQGAVFREWLSADTHIRQSAAPEFDWHHGPVEDQRGVMVLTADRH